MHQGSRLNDDDLQAGETAVGQPPHQRGRGTGDLEKAATQIVEATREGDLGRPKWPEVEYQAA